ncbi:MAG: cyclic peptide export ABC transporter [Deltaproteobacteria bacterium]|nr:cyclic peptide export ABC transporter [Deltaproteobacteria bacterium]
MSFWRFVSRGSRGLAAIAVIAGLVSGACSAALIALINATLNSGLETSRWAVGGFVILTLTKIGSNGLANMTLEHFSQRTLAELCHDLSRRVLATPLRRLEELGVARVLTGLTEDVAVIGWAMRNVPTLAINLAILAGCSVYLAWLSWRVLAGVSVVIVSGMLGYRFLIARAYVYLQRARDTRGTLFQHFRALTDGAKELKLHARRRHAFLVEEIEPAIERLRHDNLAGTRHHLLATSWNQLLFYGLVGMLLFGVSTEPLSSGTVSGYVLASFFMMSPVWGVIESWPIFAQGQLALRKVEELRLSLVANDTLPSSTSPPAPCSWERLDMEGVRFAYEDDHKNGFVLGPLDFTLRRGEIVFLVGGNGSGKSTFVKVLTGLYLPQEGSLRLDGHAISETNREWLLNHFSVIFSDFYLFERLFGLDASDLDERARAYLSQLELTNKVTVDHGTLSTTALSQGQRKRLALLTAFLEDRSIYVFDEWAADQDPHYREIFYNLLLPDLAARGKTILVISHDDRYYDRGDRIIKLEYGTLVSDTRTKG